MNTVQIYNVAQNTWSVGQPMPTARANLAVATCGVVIVATGGRLTAAGGVSSIVEAYETPQNQWVGPLTPMPTEKSEHSSVSHGNLLYVTGSGIFGASLPYHEALTCSSLYGNKS